MDSPGEMANIERQIYRVSPTYQSSGPEPPGFLRQLQDCLQHHVQSQTLSLAMAPPLISSERNDVKLPPKTAYFNSNLMS
jgi:hypothetical protein